MMVLLLDKTHQKNADIVGPTGFWFSLDYLLPVIRLNEAHFEDIDMSWYARIYFYIHQLLGYVLVFVVVAGLGDVAIYHRN